jgi:hypothetical protein
VLNSFKERKQHEAKYHGDTRMRTLPNKRLWLNEEFNQNPQ